MEPNEIINWPQPVSAVCSNYCCCCCCCKDYSYVTAYLRYYVSLCTCLCVAKKKRITFVCAFQARGYGTEQQQLKSTVEEVNSRGDKTMHCRTRSFAWKDINENSIHCQWHFHLRYFQSNASVHTRHSKYVSHTHWRRVNKKHLTVKAITKSTILLASTCMKL